MNDTGDNEFAASRRLSFTVCGLGVLVALGLVAILLNRPTPIRPDAGVTTRDVNDQRPRRQRTLNVPAANPYRAEVQKAGPRVYTAEPSTKPTILVTHPARVRTEQMSTLREQAVAHANDDPGARPSLEDIAAMEANGVMVW
jgi:hypothetical protein